MRLRGPAAPISKRLTRRHSKAIRTMPPIRLHITSFLIGSYAHTEEIATPASAFWHETCYNWPDAVACTCPSDAGPDNVRSGERVEGWTEMRKVQSMRQESSDKRKHPFPARSVLTGIAVTVMWANLLAGSAALADESHIAPIPPEELWASSGHADPNAEAFRHWDDTNPPAVPVTCAKCHSTPGISRFPGRRRHRGRQGGRSGAHRHHD